MNRRDSQFVYCLRKALHAFFYLLGGGEGVVQPGVVNPRAGGRAEGVAGDEGHLFVNGYFEKIVSVDLGEVYPVEETALGPS